MNSINNVIKGLIFIALAFAFVVTITSTDVFAFGESGGSGSGSGGDSGCCDYTPSPKPYTPPSSYTPPSTYTPPTTVSKPVAKCVSFTANKTSVPYGGGNVTLSWSTKNATSVSINNGVGTVGASGSKTVNVSANTTFTLTAKGTGGNDSCVVTIKVEAPKPVAKCVSFTANKTSVPYGGGPVNLSWTTQNASSVTISGIGSGLPANKSGHTVNVTGNTTFTLTAIGAGGNDSHCKVTITVQSPAAPVCTSFTANKNVVSSNGETVRLTWNTQNATSVSINGIGNVTPASSGHYDVFVNSNKTFTLTVNGDGGQTTCTVSITTETTHVETPRCNYLNASDHSNLKRGDRITLSWSTTNADQVTIDPRPGSVSVNGSEQVTIYDDVTTFTLRARNLSENTESTCTVTVRIDKESEKTPRCDLEVSKTRVNKGDKVTLSWDTNYADRVRIRDDRGNTIFDTNDYSSSKRHQYLDGEIDVIINRTTEFTLNAIGDGGSRTCRVEVKTDDLAVYEKRDQGYVIALTQVPYTGFEAGPFLTFLFYAMLTLWALFIAYVLVIKKGSILGFSLYGAGQNAGATADAANRKKVEALVAKYSGLNRN